jgi:hypothetical protein
MMRQLFVLRNSSSLLTGAMESDHLRYVAFVDDQLENVTLQWILLQLLVFLVAWLTIRFPGPLVLWRWTKDTWVARVVHFVVICMP